MSSSLFLGWVTTIFREPLIETGLSWLHPDDLRLMLAVGFTGAYATFPPSNTRCRSCCTTRAIGAGVCTVSPASRSGCWPSGSEWSSPAGGRGSDETGRRTGPVARLPAEHRQIRLGLRRRPPGAARSRQAARRRHVLRGIYGLDCTGQVLESRLWSLVEHVPVIIEFVDEGHAILPFLADVEQIISEALVTLERAHVLVYRRTRDSAAMRLNVPAPVPDLSTLPSAEELAAMKMTEEGQAAHLHRRVGHLGWPAPVQRHRPQGQELDLAGATVLRGPMGFGANSRLHTTRLLDLSTDLPLVIEVVDSAANLEKLLPFLDEAAAEGLITIESVRVLRYRHNDAPVPRDSAGLDSVTSPLGSRPEPP